MGGLLVNNNKYKYQEDNYPKLFNPNPICIKYDSNNKLLLNNFEQYTNKYDNILITQNIYSKKNMVINKKKCFLNDYINFHTKNSHKIYAYTVYGIKNNKYWYLGESEPYKMTKNNIVSMNSIFDMYIDRDDFKNIYGGIQIINNKPSYFDIIYKYNTFNNNKLNKFKYKINKQYFYSNKRINLYHNAHDYAINSRFIKYIINSYKNQNNYSNRLKLINAIYRFVTSINWVEDNDSLNSIEYIRTPQHTCLSYRGDCKDTTILLNGLLSQLNIKTAILFSPGHMLTGIRLSDLTDYELSNIYHDYESNIYESSRGDKYIPAETTRSQSIGNGNGEQIHTIYDGSYTVVNSDLYLKHANEVLKYIIK